MQDLRLQVGILRLQEVLTRPFIVGFNQSWMTGNRVVIQPGPDFTVTDTGAPGTVTRLVLDLLGPPTVTFKDKMTLGFPNEVGSLESSYDWEYADCVAVSVKVDVVDAVIRVEAGNWPGVNAGPGGNSPSTAEVSTGPCGEAELVMQLKLEMASGLLPAIAGVTLVMARMPGVDSAPTEWLDYVFSSVPNAVRKGSNHWLPGTVIEASVMEHLAALMRGFMLNVVVQEFENELDGIAPNLHALLQLEVGGAIGNNGPSLGTCFAVSPPFPCERFLIADTTPDGFNIALALDPAHRGVWCGLVALASIVDPQLGPVFDWIDTAARYGDSLDRSGSMAAFPGTGPLLPPIAWVPPVNGQRPQRLMRAMLAPVAADFGMESAEPSLYMHLTSVYGYLMQNLQALLPLIQDAMEGIAAACQDLLQAAGADANLPDFNAVNDASDLMARPAADIGAAVAAALTELAGTEEAPFCFPTAPDFESDEGMPFGERQAHFAFGISKRTLVGLWMAVTLHSLRESDWEDFEEPLSPRGFDVYQNLQEYRQAAISWLKQKCEELEEQVGSLGPTSYAYGLLMGRLQGCKKALDLLEASPSDEAFVAAEEAARMLGHTGLWNPVPGSQGPIVTTAPCCWIANEGGVASLLDAIFKTEWNWTELFGGVLGIPLFWGTGETSLASATWFATTVGVSCVIVFWNKSTSELLGLVDVDTEWSRSELRIGFSFARDGDRVTILSATNVDDVQFEFSFFGGAYELTKPLPGDPGGVAPANTADLPLLEMMSGTPAMDTRFVATEPSANVQRMVFPYFYVLPMNDPQPTGATYQIPFGIHVGVNLASNGSSITTTPPERGFVLFARSPEAAPDGPSTEVAFSPGADTLCDVTGQPAGWRPINTVALAALSAHKLWCVPRGAQLIIPVLEVPPPGQQFPWGFVARFGVDDVAFVMITFGADGMTCRVFRHSGYIEAGAPWISDVPRLNLSVQNLGPFVVPPKSSSTSQPDPILEKMSKMYGSTTVMFDLAVVTAAPEGFVPGGDVEWLVVGVPLADLLLPGNSANQPCPTLVQGNNAILLGNSPGTGLGLRVDARWVSDDGTYYYSWTYVGLAGQKKNKGSMSGAGRELDSGVGHQKFADWLKHLIDLDESHFIKPPDLMRMMLDRCDGAFWKRVASGTIRPAKLPNTTGVTLASLAPKRVLGLKPNPSEINALLLKLAKPGKGALGTKGRNKKVTDVD